MRDSRYDILFEPIKIGPVTAKNRFYQVPHCTGSGALRPRILAGLRESKAEGGWAVVNTEYCSVHPSSDDLPYPSASLWDDRDIKAHALMTEKVHRYGALAGLVESLDTNSSSITGTTDSWPILDQFNLLIEVVKSAKTVGVIHNPAEANSVSSMKSVREATSKLGLNLIEVPVSSSGEVPAAVRSLVGRIDAIYLPADNTVISALPSIVSVAEGNSIPLMPGDTSNVEVGGFGTIGHSYYAIGRKSGELASMILNGTPIEDIPVTSSSVYEYYFNLKSAEKQGVIIPKSLLDRAANVYN